MSDGKLKFTLVEMMIVIAIIGILTMLLLPALAGSRRKARSATCMNNLRQVVIAELQYIEDYYGLTMTGVVNFSKPSGNAQLYWSDFLNAGTENHPIATKYLPEKNDVFHCPEISLPKDTAGKVNLTTYRSHTYGKVTFDSNDLNDSYCGAKISRWASFDGANNSGNRQVAVRAIRDQANFLLFADTINLDGKQSHSFNPKRYFTFSGSAAGIHLRHDKSKIANGAFLDGHVEQLTDNRLAELGVKKIIVGDAVKLEKKDLP